MGSSSLGQLEKRKQEDELRRLKQEEEKFQRIKVGGLLLFVNKYICRSGFSMLLCGLKKNKNVGYFELVVHLSITVY